MLLFLWVEWEACTQLIWKKMWNSDGKLIQDSYIYGAINIHDFFKYIYLTLFHHLLGTIQISKGKGLGQRDLPCDTKETVPWQTKKGSGEESVYKHKKSIVVMNHFPSDSDFSPFMFTWQKKWNKLSKIKQLQIKLKNSLTFPKMSDFPGHRQKDFNKKIKNIQNKNTNLWLNEKQAITWKTGQKTGKQAW